MTRRISNELLILIGSVIVLAIVALLTTFFLPQGEPHRSSINSDRYDGVSTLREWLENAGFEVRRLTSNPLDPGDNDVLFIISPPGSHTPDEAERIHEWVRAGGRLIVVSGDSISALNAVLAPFDVEMTNWTNTDGDVALTAPTLTNPVFNEITPLFSNRAATIDTTNRPDAVVHLANEQAAYFVSMSEGEGQIYISGLLYPFINGGLRSDPGAQRLVSNILAGLTPGETAIAFDEAQRFSGAEQLPSGVMGWLLTSTAGRGVILFGLIMLTYLISQGRRFGAPVPLVEDRLRREPVEYIIALANLFRRSGRRPEVMQHYKARLRRHLSERYALDPALPDEQFAQRAAARDKSISSGDLLRLLRRLDDSRVSEADLLNTAAEVETWLKRTTTGTL